MKSLPQKLIPIALVSVCLVWLGVSLYSYNSASALIAAQEAEARTRDVLLRLEDLFSDLKDVTIAQRGFVLTGQEDYLVSHDAVVQQLAPKLDALRALMGAQPAQQQRLGRLEQLTRERSALSQQIIAARRTQGFTAAQELVRTHEGSQAMNEVHDVVKELEAQELRSLAGYEASTGHRAWRTLNALVAINLITLLFIGLFFNTLRRGLQHSRRAAAELQQAKTGLEQHVAERTAELTATNAQLRESEERFSKAFNTSPHLMTITTLAEGRYSAVNDAVLRATGYTRAEMIGHTAEELRIFAEPEGRAKLLNAFHDGAVRDLEIRLRMKDGGARMVLLAAEVITIAGEQCVLTVSHDITERKLLEQQIAGQNAVLEAVALGQPLTEILRMTTQAVERQLPGALGSVLLANDDATQLFCGAAPNLPGAYNAAIEGVSIGENVGSCGTAGFRRAPVIVTDIANDPLWADFRELALSHNLRACWSHPIISPGGKLLGTLATYFHAPRAPRPAELHMFEAATRVAGIAIERKWAEEALRSSEERYRAFVAQSSEAIWRFEVAAPIAVTLAPDEQIEQCYQYAYLAECNDVMAQQYGYESAADIIGARLGDLMPHTEAANIEYLRQFILSGYRLTEAESHEVDRTGQPRYFLNNLIGIVEDGRLTRAWGTQRDITERKQAEDALRESEERFRTLTRILTSVVWQTDAAGAFVTPQPEWAAFTGQNWEEHRGWGWGDALHADDRARVQELWRRALEQRTLYESRGRVWHAPTSDYHYFVARAVPLCNADGSIRAWIGTITDVHDQVAEERNIRFLADFSETIRLADDPEELMSRAAAAVGAHLQAAQCFFTEVELGADRFTVHGDYHTGAASLAGSYRRSDFSPVVIAELNAGHTVAVADALQDARTAPYQDNYRRVGIGAFVAAPLLREARQVSSLIVSAAHARPWTAREIGLIETVAERAWLAVEKLRAEAATARLLQQEQRARAHAEAANRSKDEFLAVLSHELRSPLNAIIGWNRILREERRDDAEIAKTTEIIDRNARTQLQLIEDLLDTARLISGKLRLELQTVALIEVVSAALDVVRPAAEAKEIALRTEFALEDSQIIGDPARLQQVVLNLLANAVKFTPAGGHVTVALRRAGAQVEIVVSDTGKGIKPDFLPHVFDRFAQADGSSSRRYGGLGLGLALVHHLVEMHGGAITATSAGENRGATFTIKLPLRAQTATSSASGLSQEDSALYGSLPATLLSLKGVRALVVDDEPDTRELLATTLNHYGAAEVQAVASGAEALEILRHWTPGVPSVLICDIGLPDEDGYEVIKKVRALKSAPNGAIKAIALTAFGRAEDRLRALQAGFQMHIAKPVEPTELVVVINTLLGQPGARFNNS